MPSSDLTAVGPCDESGKRLANAVVLASCVLPSVKTHYHWCSSQRRRVCQVRLPGLFDFFVLVLIVLIVLLFSFWVILGTWEVSWI